MNTSSIHTISTFSHTTTTFSTIQYVEYDEFCHFEGLGNEDLDQFWFVTKVVWTAQNITNDNMKKAQLVTALQDRVLT